MINNVQFPGLGIELELSRVAFTVGDMQIYWYGILIALGMMLAFGFALWKSRSFGINDDKFIDIIFVGTIAGIIGARAYYVVFAPFEYDNFMQMIDIRDGGLAIYGGIIVGFAAACLMCKWRKVPILPVFDLTAMGFLIGQGIGRWGNFVNQEAFGTNTNLPWGMISESTQGYLENVQTTLLGMGVVVDPTAPVHPTFLYESLWCLFGFVLLYLYMNKRKFNGEIFLMYIMWYGVERAFVEGLRTDSLNTVNDIRVSQAVALISAVAAFGIWAYERRKHAGKPLMISYDFIVFPKEKKSPTVNITWKLGDDMPTQTEIVQIYKWANLPVGVWHVDGEGGDKTFVAAKRPQAASAGIGVQPTAVKVEEDIVKNDVKQDSTGTVAIDTKASAEAETLVADKAVSDETAVLAQDDKASKQAKSTASKTAKKTPSTGTKKAKSTAAKTTKSTAAKTTKKADSKAAATENEAADIDDTAVKASKTIKATTAKTTKPATKKAPAKTAKSTAAKTTKKTAENAETTKKAAAKSTAKTTKTATKRASKKTDTKGENAASTAENKAANNTPENADEK